MLAPLALPVRWPVAGEAGTVFVIAKVVVIVLFTHVIPGALNPGHASALADTLSDDVPPLAFHMAT